MFKYNYIFEQIFINFMKQLSQGIIFNKHEVIRLVLILTTSFFAFSLTLANQAEQEVPTLIVKWETTVSINEWETYVDEWVIAYDYQQWFITQYVNRNGTVNTSIPWVYIITYSVKDEDWNYAEEKRRTVTVKKVNATAERPTIQSHEVKDYDWSTVKINFITNTATQAVVWYWLDGKYNMFSRPEKSFKFFNHTQTLENIEAWKEYSYLIFVRNGAWKYNYVKNTFTVDNIESWDQDEILDGLNELLNEIDSSTLSEDRNFIENNEWAAKESKESWYFWNHSSDTNFSPSAPWDTDSMKVVIKKWGHYASGTYFKFPSWTQEAWISYCVRLWDDWNPYTGGKFPWFAWNTTPPNGWQGWATSNWNNSWSARWQYGIYDPDTKTSPIWSYMYYTDMPWSYWDTDWWSLKNNRPVSDSATLKKNNWHAVTQHIEMNSKWKKDWLIESWVDGKQVYIRENMNFTNNDKYREVYRFWLNVYLGWSPIAKSDHTVYFDQVNYSLWSKNTSYVDCD